MRPWGLPHSIIFGKAKFRLTDVETWLESSGDLERRDVQRPARMPARGAGRAARARSRPRNRKVRLPMPTKRRSCAGRVYLGTDADGRERYDWVGRFSTKRERDAAVAVRARGAAGQRAPQLSAATTRDQSSPVASTSTTRSAEWSPASAPQGWPTVQGQLDRSGSHRAWRFVSDYGDRPLADVAGMRKGEARRWAERDDVTAGTVAVVVTLLNRAVEDDEYVDATRSVVWARTSAGPRRRRRPRTS